MFDVDKTNIMYYVCRVKQTIKIMFMTTYTKSKIMKEAHYLRSVLGGTMSEALKMAWKNAKSVVRRNEEARVANEERERLYKKRIENTRVVDMSHLANTLINYYNGYGYKGD